MQVDAPQLTQVLNLLIAIGIFASIVGGGLLKLRNAQRKDMQAIVTSSVAPLEKKAGELETGQNALAEKFDRLNSAVLGHESRLSFVEGKEAGRVEGWTQAQRGMPLKPQIPIEEQEL